jgi:hypothetical protein
LALFIILFIAFGLILGFFPRQKAFRKLGRVLIMAAFVPFFISLSKNYFYQLPSEQKLLFSIVLIVGGFFVLLRIVLDRDLFNEVMGRFVYSGLKAIFIFPFKIVSKLLRTYK